MFNLPLGWNATPFPCRLLLPTQIWSLRPLTPPEVSPAWPAFSSGPCPVVHTPFLILSAACESQKLDSISWEAGYLHMFNSWPHFWGPAFESFPLEPSTDISNCISQLSALSLLFHTVAFSPPILLEGLPWDRVSIMVMVIIMYGYHYCDIIIFVYGLLGGACVTGPTHVA